MADASLDDFFAKKDKSKKKTKSKITPGDILAKTATPAETETKKKKKKEKVATSGGPAAAGDTSEVTGQQTKKTEKEEEWEDYEVEEEKDYSGLRIQNLQIKNKEEAEGEEEKENNDEDEDGEPREKRETVTGPWNQSTQPPQQQQQQVAAPVAPPEPEPPKEDTPKTVGKYIPPGARAGSGAAGPSLEPTRLTPGSRLRKKTAPNLQSQEEFPTLGGGVGDVSPGAAWGSNFQRVQAGGKQVEDASKTNAQLTLGNKYAALQD